jgi:hypothetical protein
MDTVKSAARRARASRQLQLQQQQQYLEQQQHRHTHNHNHHNHHHKNNHAPMLEVEETPGELKRVFSPTVALDQKDPNYDSEDENNDVALVPAVEEPPGMQLASLSPTSYRYLASARGGNALAKTQLELSNLPALSLQEFKKQSVKVIQELFISEELEEFVQSVVELRSPTLHYELVRRLMSLAIERNNRAREIASRALVALCVSGTLSVEQAAMGFKRLFEIADDLTLDAPFAKEIVARFLARAVADEVLPPAFLTDPTIEKMGAEIVAQAKTLLSIRHSRARLSRVWQVPVGLDEDAREEITPLLKAEIKLLLNEYLNSGDINEAIDCVRRLEAPHFGHEIVKRAVVLALDGRQMQRAMMSALLTELVLSGALSSEQVELGFERLVEELDDLELDTPGAKRVVKIFFEQAVKDGIVRKVPTMVF